MRKVNIKNKKEDSDESKGGFCKNQVEVRIFFVKTTLVFLPMDAGLKNKNGVENNAIFETVMILYCDHLFDGCKVTLSAFRLCP